MYCTQVTKQYLKWGIDNQMNAADILGQSPYKKALLKVLDWSQTKPSTVNKEAAKVYVQAMPQAEEEGEYFYGNPAKGRSLQILYILNNLRGWRGEEAREAKKALNEQYEKDKRF